MEYAKQVVAEDLKKFEFFFRKAIKSKVALLDIIMAYIIKRKGKQLRPMFVFLAAQLGGYVNEKTYRAAALVELLHTATLVHDDVVDSAMERRSFFSINALWKNKIAVLVGDYLLSKGLLLSLQHKDFDILEILSNAVKEMSEGELLQMEKTRSLNLDEAVYFEIIKGKTASLLASSCAAGAASTCSSEEAIEKAKKFGEKVGIAFQIKDDILDYTSEKIGKPTGNDIKEKKITLPLIYTLNKVDFVTRQKMIFILKYQNKNPKKIKWVLQQVQRMEGIEYAEKTMEIYKTAALNLLLEFPSSPARKALEELVQYVITRKY